MLINIEPSLHPYDKELHNSVDFPFDTAAVTFLEPHK